MTSSPVGYTLSRDVGLQPRNTFRIDARARWFATVHDAPSLTALLDERDVRDLPLLVLGQGSNVLFAEPWFEGLVVHLVCDGLRVLQDAPGEHAAVQVEAAHDWDSLVDRTLQRGMRGLENLALIPGQVGAAPRSPRWVASAAHRPSRRVPRASRRIRGASPRREAVGTRPRRRCAGPARA